MTTAFGLFTGFVTIAGLHKRISPERAVAIVFGLAMTGTAIDLTICALGYYPTFP